MVGKLSQDIEMRLFAAQNGLCVCCGCNLGNNYHVDHIMPLALGGTNTDDNVQLLRAECNMRKAAKHPDKWRKILAQK
jgi:5-methylcytosine-specific restriction endonuclease McrA